MSWIVEVTLIKREMLGKRGKEKRSKPRRTRLYNLYSFKI